MRDHIWLSGLEDCGVYYINEKYHGSLTFDYLGLLSYDYRQPQVGRETVCLA